MSELKNNFIGFLPEDKRQILGLTDEIGYHFLPMLINFSIFSLNIINSIKNNFSTYAFLFDFEDKSVQDYLSNPGYNVKVEPIGISLTDNYNFFNSSILGYLNSKKIEDEEYISFIPCNINYFWNSNFNDLKENGYILKFNDNDSIGFVLKVKYLKFIFEKGKIEHFNNLYQFVLSNIKPTLDVKEYFSFKVNSLKEYLELHLQFFENYKLYAFINDISNYFEKMGETVISKEAEVINSFIGYNSVIRGKVEDSIIFNDVIILNDTHIQNSIILPGNVLAKGVKAKNTIIGFNKNTLKDITIGPNTKIGFPSHDNLKNVIYEKELPEGYSLIGNNILLPGGINIGKNCVLKGKINVLELKKMKTLIDGGTFEQDSGF
ncbi:MAG TPA: hypothetical protein PLF21_04085 [Exilispira sp.]|nr:hypothetical protein [Exilispira sp.]